jgi:hypothetical protein
VLFHSSEYNSLIPLIFFFYFASSLRIQKFIPLVFIFFWNLIDCDYVFQIECNFDLCCFQVVELSLIFSLPSYFEKINVGLWDHLAVCVSICVWSPVNFWMPETVYMKLGMCLSGILHKYFPSVCVSVCVSPLSLLGNGSVNTFPR